jgi:hypothetical protein
MGEMESHKEQMKIRKQKVGRKTLRNNLGDLNVDGRIILKWILKRDR